MQHVKCEQTASRSWHGWIKNACVSLMSTPLVLKVFFRDRKILGWAALAAALGWGWWDENNGFWLQHQPYSQLATPVLATWLIISENPNLWLHILTATSLFVYLASPYCWFIFLQTIPCHLQMVGSKSLFKIHLEHLAGLRQTHRLWEASNLCPAGHGTVYKRNFFLRQKAQG